MCVVMDKLDKIAADVGGHQGGAELTQGLPAETANKIVDCLACKSVDELQASSAAMASTKAASTNLSAFSNSAECPAATALMAHLRNVKWRALVAYYTGIVFEGFDRAGEFAPFAVAVDTTSYSPCTAP